jgi:hypothetical protein
MPGQGGTVKLEGVVVAMMAMQETAPAKTGQSRRDGMDSRAGLD